MAEGLAKADAGDGRMLLELLDTIPGNPARDDYQTAVLAVDQQYGHKPPHRFFDLIERSERKFPHFWFLSGHWDLVRALWPANDRDAFRGRIRNPPKAAPILVVGMTHDPATPYFQAQRLTADLGNARLLTFDADGHGAATSFDPCVLQAVAGYVIAGVVPAQRRGLRAAGRAVSGTGELVLQPGDVSLQGREELVEVGGERGTVGEEVADAPGPGQTVFSSVS